MKRKLYVASIAMASMSLLPLQMQAEERVESVSEQAADSLSAVQLQDVLVVSTRAKKNTPMAFSDMKKSDIDKVNHGQDIPFLLSTLPSVTMTTDAGNGIGYTSLRVRGTDASRINITSNGVPMNDAESSLMYWVNVGDMASSLQSMQLQRGVGTSTNGAGAFGATLNLQTENIGYKPFFSVDLSGGSYLSHKETVRFGTGLIGDHWGIQGRLSNIGSKGYVDRASTKLNSYFLQAGYFADRTMVKLLTYNSTEETYHAWNYVSHWEQDEYGRTYNSCGEYYDEAGNRCYYKDQTDNYHQQNWQLHLSQLVGDYWKLNAALHYTKGDGYYNQYKTKRTLFEYRLDDGETWAKSDLVRQKAMDNNFYGLVASANYDNERGLQLSIGGGINKYDGDHIGYVTWVKSPVEGTSFTPDWEYYNNNTKKVDGNIYGKLQYSFASGLSAYLDLQYRHVSVKMDGTSDVYDWSSEPYTQIVYDLDKKYDFFNPKAGLSYQFNPNMNLYASFAVAHREPLRNNFQLSLDAQSALPTPETLYDLEVGYKYQSRTFSAGANLYYMNYKDQFVQTGELDDNGETVTANLDKSYRLGIELEAAWQPVDWFRWDANITQSKNRVKDVNVTLEDGKTVATITGWQPLAFSPETVLNNIFTFTYEGFRASIHTNFVSAQYLTNTGFKAMQCEDEDGNATEESLQLKSHCSTNVDLSYTFDAARWKALRRLSMKSITAGLTVYNLFSAKYDNNGWAAPQYRQQTDGTIIAVNTWGPRDAYATGFAPSAPFNVMAHLSINF